VHKRKISVAIGLIAVASLIAACGSSNSSSASADSSGSSKDPIIIGMPVALSGAFSYFDLPWLHGAELGVKDINAKGGVMGRPLKIVTADTKSDIAQGTNAALQVISDGAQFMLPTVDVDYGGAAARVASQKNLISISSVGDPRWGVQGFGPLVYNVYQAAPTEAASNAAFTKEQGWSRPYVLADQAINYTKTLGKLYSSEWKSLTGQNVVGYDTFSNGDASIASQISRIKDTSPAPDVIVLSSFQPGGISAIKQIRAAGLKQPILANVVWGTQGWIPKGTNDLDVYAPALGSLTDDPRPAVAKIYDDYRATYGDLNDNIDPLAGYSAIQALAKAITEADSTDTAKVQAELNKFDNVDLVIGPTTWTSTCHIPLGRPFLYVKPTSTNIKVVAQGPKTDPKSIC
jgi:branched-chain amino acid transport system substrate-binding protein